MTRAHKGKTSTGEAAETEKETKNHNQNTALLICHFIP